MKKLLTEWRKFLKESLRDSLIQAGEEACGYMNCKLFVQTVTNIPKLDNLPSRPYTSPSDLEEGDILKWGTGLHYAIYVGDGEVMEVEEWGAESRVIPLEEAGEGETPDVVLSTT